MSDDFLESFGGDPELEAELRELIERAVPVVPAGLEATPGLSGQIRADPGLEAIVRRYGRPSLLIFRDTYESANSAIWRQRLDAHQEAIEHAIRATGRIEVKGIKKTHLGTAWMIEDNIAVTNRHVASIFARERNGVFEIGQDATGQPLRVVVDFVSELDNTAANEIDITEVLYIASKFGGEPDVAFLLLDTTAAVPAAAVLADDKLSHPQELVATVGYPAFDSRNNAADQQRIFGGRYNVKRLAPGFVQELRPATITHDCTTLGGNSGSLLLSLEQGGVIGLHYSGVEGDENRAVRVSEVRRLLDRALGRSDDGPTPAPGPGDGPGDHTEAPKPLLEDRVGYVADDFLGAGISVPAPRPLDDADEVLTARTDSDAGVDVHELTYHHFSSWMHAERKLPLVTAANIDGEFAKGVKRKNDRWFLDDRIPHDAQVGEELYSHNALDRGHLVRRLDPAWGDLAAAAVVDTFHFTNCAPQHEALNRREWLALEDHILESAKTHGFKACVFTGPKFTDDDPTYRGVKLPQAFWKIVVTLREPDGPGEEPTLGSSGYILSQEELIADLEFAFGAFRTFQVPVDRIRKLALLDIDQALLDADAMLRSGTEGVGYRTIWDVADVVL